MQMRRVFNFMLQDAASFHLVMYVTYKGECWLHVYS